MDQASAAWGGVPKLEALIPMARVSDVARSLDWYSRLGFAVMYTFTPPGSALQWAHLRCGGAELMLVRSDGAIDPKAQGVMFYLYVAGVARFRAWLFSEGLQPDELKFPPYATRGEFRIVDPDGYCLLVGDTDQRG